jgi:hypothetical protein
LVHARCALSSILVVLKVGETNAPLYFPLLGKQILPKHALPP